MFKQATKQQDPAARLKTYFFVCAFVIMVFPFRCLAQDNIYNADNTPVVVDGNADMIVYLNGDNLSCRIDKVDRTRISYHIRKRGPDLSGNVTLSRVIKYYYRNQWHDAFRISPSNEKARNLLLEEKINEAIGLYGQLISKDTANAVLLSEDAYALALGGIYEAALMRLDRSWSLGINSPDVNYFTGQVFALMGYDDLTREIWKSSGKFKTPGWVASKAPVLLEKYRSETSLPSIKSRNELIARFKLANELAARNSNFQAIAVFHEITRLYPDEYLPYVGYSITMEKAGALEKSAQTIEKAMSLAGSKTEDLAKKQFLEQRLGSLRQKMTLLPAGSLPGLYPLRPPVAESPQMMAYLGGTGSPAYTSINGRLGYFISGSSNASLDFGVTNVSGSSSANLGLSAYDRNKYFVYGVGFLLNSANGATATYLKLSMGLSKMNRSRTSSFDVFLDINNGLGKQGVTFFSLSVGNSIYFGKRK